MKRRRSGFTLIELTVVLTVLTLVWLSITSVLYTLYRTDHRLRDDLQREHAFDRFVMRLRLDTHAASSASLVKLVDSSTELVLPSVNERTVHYGTSVEGLYRVVREGEAVVHRDTFLIGRAASEWELDSPDDPSLVVLTVTDRDERSQSTRVRRIKAAVALVSAATVESPGASS